MLLTLGTIFLGVIGLGLFGRKEGDEPFPGWLLCLMTLMTILAVLLILVGLFGSRKVVDSWVDSATTHEASILVMIIAAPVYFVLKALERK